MKYSLLFLFILIVSVFAGYSQKSKPSQSGKTVKGRPVTAAPTPKKLVSDKEEFAKAVAIEGFDDRAAAFRQFIADFPDSALVREARDRLSATLAAGGSQKLLIGDIPAGIAQMRAAAESLAAPVADRFFVDTVSKIPFEVRSRAGAAQAIEIAAIIESKTRDNSRQLLVLSDFYVQSEDGDKALRTARRAVELSPASSDAYQSLALAQRVNFEIKESADSYSKAVELAGDSLTAKRGLADMSRALGNFEEAAAGYREILAKDPSHLPSQTGLILSLLDAGKVSEGETELARAAAENPNNVVLLAGAAYWYASKGNGDRAAELAAKAIEADPRYVWSHLALARALLLKNRPVDAEEVLLRARQYGRFPTVDYEIAVARLNAGFYLDAADELRKSFSVKDGVIHVRLGGRVEHAANSFADLVGLERRASIFEPAAIEQTDIGDRLKALVELENELRSPQPNDELLIRAADAFMNGDDRMKLHRQLFVALRLLDHKRQLTKVIDLTTAARGNTDAALELPNAAAATMASVLYESRATALAKNEFLRVPDVPRPMLSAILRGRIEEIAGWALYYQNNPSESVVRLRRAVSVLPEKSVWWRSSMWKLGAALQADGKDDEALDAYIKSYNSEEPDAIRYSVVESLFRKVKGSTDGLADLIGPNPAGGGISETPAATDPTLADTAVSEKVSSSVPVSQPNTDQQKQDEKLPVEISVAPEKKPETVERPGEKTTGQDASDSANVAAKSSSEAVPPETHPSPTPEPQTLTDPDRGAAKPAKVDNSGVAETKKSAVELKSAFEPIIITVPVGNPKKPAPGGQIPSTSEADLLKTTTQTSDSKSPPSDKAPDPTSEPAAVDATAPSRSVAGNESAVMPICEIATTQDKISLVAGGSIGVLAGFDGDLATLHMISGSPSDIEVVREPDIAGMANRAFYLIRSLNSKSGIYQISVEVPCGKKEILITVRQPGTEPVQ